MFKISQSRLNFLLTFLVHCKLYFISHNENLVHRLILHFVIDNNIGSNITSSVQFVGGLGVYPPLVPLNPPKFSLTLYWLQ